MEKSELNDVFEGLIDILTRIVGIVQELKRRQEEDGIEQA